MRSFSIFILLAILTAGVMVAVPFIVSPDRVYIAEGIMLVIACVEIWLYISLVLPVKALTNGMNLIKAQDYTSRLSQVHQHDADHLISIFNTLMDTLHSERLSREERNQFLSQLIEQSPTGIIIFDFEGRIADINPAACRTLRLIAKPSIGNFLSDLNSELARRCAYVEDGKSITIRLSDTEIIKCSRHHFIDRGAERQFLSIENMTEEVRRAEKEAYHRVIRMLAHEVNNTMTGLTTTLDAIDFAIGDEPEIHDLLAGSHDRCESLSRFITSYASVVKMPEPVPTRNDLNLVVERQLPFLESIATPIPIEVNYCKENVYVDIDTTMWEQVIVNIVKNAAESIGDTSGGSIVINISINQCQPTLTITDNGKGISDDVASHLFAPFFSTKSQGNGIGLIVVSEILRRHGCSFSLETSKTDGLTRFTIVFPTA